MTLLAIPNFSEGRDRATIARLGAALEEGGALLLDTHSDADHNRTVYTLAGNARQLGDSLISGARVAVECIDIFAHSGAHPHVGALDVAPFVHTEPTDRGAAAAGALVIADRLADELSIPVFLYGSLSAEGVTRAQLRHGGPTGLMARMAAGEVSPDYGPLRLHPRAGATLVSARPPLIALNFELAAPADLAAARRIAARIREGGADGLVGVRAIGVELRGPVAQVSTNIEDPDATRPGQVLAAVRAHAEVSAAELVGLPPARYFDDFPRNLALKHFRMLEEALPC